MNNTRTRLQTALMPIMADDTDDSGGVILEGPHDPDAQATVTDFIDYTEYLPSDLIRSLTLIRGLDRTYLEAAQNVHELTKSYGQLPETPTPVRPKAQALRKQISIQLDRAINARESSYAEACRLYDVVDRHFNRLGSIKRKLEALPKPVSFDPSPPPGQIPIDNKRSRNAKKVEEGTTRITLRLESQDTPAVGTQKLRSQRSGALGHLVGFNPDSPIASNEHSDNEAEAKGEGSQPSDKMAAATSRPRKDKSRKRLEASRPPGPGTNVHSSVAGISTSNALALLNPPPDDAKKGSEDLPWLRLTEWELTKLRKKMKKNAVWQPSEIMIYRELLSRGRGWEGYRIAKEHAEEAGEELIDCDDIENNYVPGKLIRKGDPAANSVGMQETKINNRGIKLNEAKKIKRENLAREQAAQAAAEAELAAKRLGEIGSTFKSIFPSPADFNNGGSGNPDSSLRSGGAIASQDKEKLKPQKKRKAEESPTVETSISSQNPDSNLPAGANKRRRPNWLDIADTTAEMLSMDATAPTARSSTSTSLPSLTSRSGASRKLTPTPSPTGSKPSAGPSVPSPGMATASRKVSHTPTPPATWPPSRRCSTTVLTEPSAAAVNAAPSAVAAPISTREHLRRKSATPAAKTPAPELPRPSSSAAATTAASRRSKRPAPGPVSSGQDGGAAVSYGRRKAKPSKKKAASRDQGHKELSGQTAKSEDIRIDEDGVLEEIDPNEPRYCLCGDVSFGTMICCENTDCDKEWFHLECVGLADVPSRTAKWYCPDCRIKLHKGPDGIVKTGSSRR